jgi:hypothetical protein
MRYIAERLAQIREVCPPFWLAGPLVRQAVDENLEPMAIGKCPKRILAAKSPRSYNCPQPRRTSSEFATEDGRYVLSQTVLTPDNH